MTRGVHPLAGALAALGRFVSGVQVRWDGCQPELGQRVYFANHTSHLDFVVLWSALPAGLRAVTRPVAAKDYWEKGLRAYLALRVFRAVLVARGAGARRDPGQTGAAGHPVIESLAEALGQTDSLIFFPEGTRGTGEEVAPFRSGLYHLARRRPDVELVPAFLENLNRILPKGEVLPVPLLSSLTFGQPIHLAEDETRIAFLARAREVVCGLRPRGLT
jgi:1-acyl-sn-glycerol-3-phosphate acyltransferase